MPDRIEKFRALLQQGLVIPAHPLALTEDLKLDERRQRALTRYYCDAGSGGVAIGVHTTQFAIRERNIGLFEPVLELAYEELCAFESRSGKTMAKIGGICGDTKQACEEAATLRRIGYDGGLLSLAALSDASNDALIEHCRAIGETIPVIGFYLQRARRRDCSIYRQRRQHRGRPAHRVPVWRADCAFCGRSVGAVGGVDEQGR